MWSVCGVSRHVENGIGKLHALFSQLTVNEYSRTVLTQTGIPVMSVIISLIAVKYRLPATYIYPIYSLFLTSLLRHQ